MFERLADPARDAITAAARYARQQGRATIGAEHLLLGLLDQQAGPVPAAIAAAGVQASQLRAALGASHGPADPLDAPALASLGIDLDDVRRATDAAFGAGALDRARPPRRRQSRPGAGSRFAADAARSMASALRLTAGQGQRRIGTGQLLAGILDQPDNAAVRALAALGADPAALRADLIRRTDAAA
jgi:ATP-dependent Clp protease ATP-binding subunit ClpA